MSTQADSNNTVSDPTGQEVTEAVVGLLARYRDALHSLDVGRITPFYADDPDFMVYLDGQVVTREGLIAGVTELCTSLERLEAEWDDIRVTVLSADAAIAGVRFQRITVPRAGDPITEWGAATWVCVRRPKGWQFIHGHGIHLPGPLPWPSKEA